MRFLKNILPFYFLGFFTCAKVIELYQFNPVIASCLCSLPLALIPNSSCREFSIIFYCGTFAAMTSRFPIANTYTLILLSITGSIIYYFSEKYFKGIGGKLGAISFVNISLYLILQSSL